MTNHGVEVQSLGCVRSELSPGKISRLKMHQHKALSAALKAWAQNLFLRLNHTEILYYEVFSPVRVEKLAGRFDHDEVMMSHVSSGSIPTKFRGKLLTHMHVIVSESKRVHIFGVYDNKEVCPPEIVSI